MKLWRVIPYDPNASEGERFSASYAPLAQGSGRFDLSSSNVLYLAEDPEHAVGEKIARFRGKRLTTKHLLEFHLQLALTSIDISQGIADNIVDLCDPTTQVSLEIQSDQLAADDRNVTQAVAAKVHSAGFAGLRWWSSIKGEWHSIILFMDKVGVGKLTHETVATLNLNHASVIEAAKVLGMPI